jgi:hypothetical protein
MPTDESTAVRNEFRLKEFECLRKEIEYRTANQCTIERNVIVAITAVYVAMAYVRAGQLSWLHPLELYLWFIPALVSVAAAGRFFDDHVVIKNIGKYIKTRELLFDPEDKGWQNSEFHWAYVRYGLKIRWLTRMTVGLTLWEIRKLFWLFLVLGTFVVPFIVSGYTPSASQATR